MKPPIYVTRPYLPPLEEFLPYLRDIWSSRHLTNGGPFHTRLESELEYRLEVEHISLFANGTIALVTALQALRVSGEVITTPYSFVATSHSLLWNNLTPVFADVDPETGNLDPRCIEAAITSLDHSHPCSSLLWDSLRYRWHPEGRRCPRPARSLRRRARLWCDAPRKKPVFLRRRVRTQFSRRPRYSTHSKAGP